MSMEAAINDSTSGADRDKGWKVDPASRGLPHQERESTAETEVPVSLSDTVSFLNKMGF